MGGRTFEGCRRALSTLYARLSDIQAKLAAVTDSLKARLEAWRSSSPVVDFILLLAERDGSTAGPMLGGAVAFRLFLFVIPVVLTLVGLLGFLSRSVSAADASEIAGIEGALRNQIELALNQAQSTRWVALGVGLWGTMWTGRSLAKTLVAVSSYAWQVPVRRGTTIKTLAAITGVLVAVFVTAGFIGRLRAESGVTVATIGFGIVFVVYLVGWFMISMLLPRGTNDPSAMLPGAFLMAGATTLIQWFSQIWLPDRFSRASQLYGALGTTAVTLSFFFIIGRLFLWSMLVNATAWGRFGTLSTLVFSAPGLRRIPIRFPRVAVFFGLEAASADVMAGVRWRSRHNESNNSTSNDAKDGYGQR